MRNTIIKLLGLAAVGSTCLFSGCQRNSQDVELGYAKGMLDGIHLQQGIDNGTYTNRDQALGAAAQMRKESLETIAALH